MKAIALTQDRFAFVDDRFYDALVRRKWFAIRRKNTYYAGRSQWVGNDRKRNITMHGEILRLAGIECADRVDHRDGNGLHNWIANLRPANRSQNQMNRKLNANNTSGFKGVNYSAKWGRWTAQIRVNGALVYLGHFATAESAAFTYNAAAIEHFGEFARLNVVPIEVG